MKQLALTAMNYESANGTLPPGSCSSIDYVKSNDHCANFSSFVRLLPYTEQSQMYNCVNMSMTYANQENWTVAGVPDFVARVPERHQQRSPDHQYRQRFWFQLRWCHGDRDHASVFLLVWRQPGDVLVKLLHRRKGGTQVQTQQNGSIILDGNVTLASITDGTSNTFVYGEQRRYFAQFDSYTTTPRRGRQACISTRCSRPLIHPTCQRRARRDSRRPGSNIISRRMRRAFTPED